MKRSIFHTGYVFGQTGKFQINFEVSLQQVMKLSIKTKHNYTVVMSKEHSFLYKS